MKKSSYINDGFVTVNEFVKFNLLVKYLLLRSYKLVSVNECTDFCIYYFKKRKDVIKIIFINYEKNRQCFH